MSHDYERLQDRLSFWAAAWLAVGLASGVALASDFASSGHAHVWLKVFLAVVTGASLALTAACLWFHHTLDDPRRRGGV
jgi:hypothetical protein